MAIHDDVRGAGLAGQVVSGDRGPERRSTVREHAAEHVAKLSSRGRGDNPAPSRVHRHAPGRRRGPEKAAGPREDVELEQVTLWFSDTEAGSAHREHIRRFRHVADPDGILSQWRTAIERIGGAKWIAHFAEMGSPFRYRSSRWFGCAPWEADVAHVQARRPAPRGRRRRWARSPAAGLAHLPVGERVTGGRLAHEAVEQQPAAAGAPSVETEHPLVEVRLQVFGRDRALERAEHPALTSENTRCVPGSSS